MDNNEQFDGRYAAPPERMDNPGVKKRSSFLIRQERENLSLLAQRPSNIDFFERLLENGENSTDRPVVGFFCNVVPVEIIRAAGARPLRLCCGNAALVQAGEEVLHGEVCPLVRSSFAEFMDPDSAANRCRALILPTTCDPKRKLGEVLSDFKPTFMLNLPPEQNFHLYAGNMVFEMGRMAEFLQKQFGTKLKRKALLKAVEEGRRRSSICRRLQAARAQKPAAMSIRDAFVILQSADTGTDIEKWMEEAEKTLKEVEAFQPERLRMRPRVVLTGAPVIWPNFKLLDLLEESGADVVADTLCSGFQSRCEAVTLDETGRKALLRALASRYVFGSTCPCFISQTNRINRVLELVEEFKADGVINHGLRLCQLFDIEVYRLSRTLKSENIPFANVRTDYSLEDKEQLRVRIEAFLETAGE